jgi:hypothetical protein
MLSDGAVYNNLDPSFATDDPTGSGKIQQPDGRFDGRVLRKQLRTLREFIESLDFIHMQPDRSAVAIPPHPGGCYALLKRGESVAVYVHSPRERTAGRGAARFAQRPLACRLAASRDR